MYGKVLGKSGVEVDVVDAGAEDALAVVEEELVIEGVEVDEGCAGSMQKKLVNDSPSTISSDQVPLGIPAWLANSNVLPFENVT